MSTNVVDPVQLQRLLDHAGLGRPSDGVGFVILARVTSRGEDRTHNPDQPGATPGPATSLLNRDIAGSLNGRELTAEPQPLQLTPLVLCERESAPCWLQIRSLGGIRNPFAKTQGGLARVFWLQHHNNRRRHALARWLAASPQLRRMA